MRVCGESVDAEAMWSTGCVTGHMLVPNAVQQVSVSDNFLVSYGMRGSLAAFKMRGAAVLVSSAEDSIASGCLDGLPWSTLVMPVLGSRLI